MFFGLVHVRRPACSVLSGLLDGSARMREGAVLLRPPLLLAPAGSELLSALVRLTTGLGCRGSWLL